MSFEFLKNIKFKENLTTPTKTPDKNPAGLSLRVFANGRVFPSIALTERFKLEFGIEGECGMDFFMSKDWTPYPTDEAQCILVGFIPRTQPKLDLFSTRRSTDTSVLTQGPISEDLRDAVKTLYGVTFEDGVNYVDLYVLDSFPINTENNIYLVPKKITRGVNKDKLQYQRRENITLYPLALSPADTPKDVVQENLLETVK